MKTTFSVLLGILFSLNVFCSGQMADKMVYADSLYSLETNPLQAYFDDFPEKRPVPTLMPSSLLRGYVATFYMKEKQLMLKDVEILSVTKTKADKDSFFFVSMMKTAFPDQEQVFCKWFSGYLILPYGKRVKIINMSYASTSENYILIKVIEGCMISEQRMSLDEYSKFKDLQFEAFKKTKDYELILKDMKKRGNSTENPENWIKLFVPMYATLIFDK